MADTIVVFTRKTIDEILEAGGSQYWRLQPANARQMAYLVCARNVKGSDGQEAHGAGFLIGRISGVVQTPDEPGRYLIQISEWAKIDCPELWTFGRNPVHYLDLADLDIDPADIDFQPLPEHEAPRAHSSNGKMMVPGIIAQAKHDLAQALGVSPSAVQITISW